MKRPSFQMSLAMSLLLVGMFAAAPVLAAPPSGGPDRFDNGQHGKNNGKGHDNHGPKDKKGYDQHGSYNHRGPDSRGDDQNRPGSGVKIYSGKHRYFTDHHRVVIHDYYAGQYRQRRYCPPGLVRKSYSCVPRGYARPWVVGRPLPRTVIFHELPPAVLVQLGPPPAHHRFVRVAQDILLIATGTGMVVDAIDNLNWEFNQ
jgi:Ni/Co efflux regulator RcnB